MRSLSTDLPFTCASCEAPTPVHPVIHLGLPFCCAGCAAGGPCICSYDPEPYSAEAATADPVPMTVGTGPRELVGAAS
jgi:hypothetical protein